MSDLGDTILNFGKAHRGKMLRDVPVHYLDWIIGLDDLKPELRESIRAYLKTQASYDAMGTDWKEGREDYTGED